MMHAPMTPKHHQMSNFTGSRPLFQPNYLNQNPPRRLFQVAQYTQQQRPRYNQSSHPQQLQIARFVRVLPYQMPPSLQLKTEPRHYPAEQAPGNNGNKLLDLDLITSKRCIILKDENGYHPVNNVPDSCYNCLLNISRYQAELSKLPAMQTNFCNDNPGFVENVLPSAAAEDADLDYGGLDDLCAGHDTWDSLVSMTPQQQQQGMLEWEHLMFDKIGELNLNNALEDSSDNHQGRFSAEYESKPQLELSLCETTIKQEPDVQFINTYTRTSGGKTKATWRRIQQLHAQQKDELDKIWETGTSRSASSYMTREKRGTLGSSSSYRATEKLIKQEIVHQTPATLVTSMYTCPNEFCTKTYKSKNGLKYHLKHYHLTPEQQEVKKEKGFDAKYACNQCDKRYVNKSGLMYHLKNFNHSASAAQQKEQKPNLQHIIKDEIEEEEEVKVILDQSIPSIQKSDSETITQMESVEIVLHENNNNTTTYNLPLLLNDFEM